MVSKPDQFVWPFLIWRVVWRNTWRISNLEAPEMIQNPTGVYGSFLIWRVVQNSTQRFSKLFAQEFIPNPTGLYVSSHLTRCPKKCLKCWKRSGPRNDPKLGRFIWPFWRIVRNITYFLQNYSPRKWFQIRPVIRFTWQFLIWHVVQKVPKWFQN